MLHYLVIYVRENLDRESPAVTSAVTRRESVQVEVAPLPAAAAAPVASGEMRTSTTLLPDPLGSQPTATAPVSPPNLAWRKRPGATALLVLLGTFPLFAGTGCACLRREKVDSNVVSARQLSLRGIDALQRGQWDDAENLFANALEKNPSDERAHRHFAEVLWHRGEHQTAIRHQEKSVRLSGGDPNLLVQLGEMYLKQGNVDAASECAAEAIDSNSDLAVAWALQGDIHRQRGEPTVAMECYHRALSHQPHYPHVQLALADLYRHANRPRRALATLSSLAGQYPADQVPPQVEFRRGLVLKELGRHQDAVETLAALAANGEPSADLLFHLGEAQFLAGNTASSRLALQAALAKTPDHSASLKLRDRLERHSQAMTAAVERQ